MAEVIPFKGIRPAGDKVHLVVTRSVDHYSKDVIYHKLLTNPFSYLHIIQPDYSDGKKTKAGTRERLEKIKKKFLEFMREEILIQDTDDSYYLYQQIKNGVVFTGIMGCASVNDYRSGIIKKHELTIKEREEKLTDYLDVCDFNTEPVLFCYKNSAIIDDVCNQTMVSTPVFDFSTADRLRHKLWCISDPAKVAIIKSEFEKINSIYIADGHHRSASSEGLCNRRNNTPGKHQHYMGIFFPENQLKIYEFNRLVTHLNGHTKSDFIEKLKEHFKVFHHEKSYTPEHAHKFSMYLDGSWYELRAKSEIFSHNDPVKNLDTNILNEYVLKPLLGIKDLRTDKNISYLPGTKGNIEIKKNVDGGKYTIGFGMYPVSMPELMRIAEISGIMPPKSTFIEPKLRSGLVVYNLNEKDFI